MPHYAEKLSASEYARLLAIVVPEVDTPQCWLCRGARGPIRYGSASLASARSVA
ncbi:hypothetical protein [Microbacterium sp. SORGH_AS_0454]|uniref:hypothetical protein n=1 Tax=Microbacterium sp. SORGH_AS_0454 TaxID=3041758 RepID=UPI002864E224|nr:hypothetical protein [Microbacterium sp. SORGH_AS_0454]MDR6098286.1 hypothetical protein [Microbacterium sp. SORGH_AS_0454]